MLQPLPLHICPDKRTFGKWATARHEAHPRFPVELHWDALTCLLTRHSMSWRRHCPRPTWHRWSREWARPGKTSRHVDQGVDALEPGDDRLHQSAGVVGLGQVGGNGCEARVREIGIDDLARSADYLRASREECLRDLGPQAAAGSGDENNLVGHGVFYYRTRRPRSGHWYHRLSRQLL